MLAHLVLLTTELFPNPLTVLSTYKDDNSVPLSYKLGRDGWSNLTNTFLNLLLETMYLIGSGEGLIISEGVYLPQG